MVNAILSATNNFNPLHAIQKSKLLPWYDTIKFDELDRLIDDDAGYTVYMGSLDNQLSSRSSKGQSREMNLGLLLSAIFVLALVCFLLVFLTGKKPNNAGWGTKFCSIIENGKAHI